MKWRCTCVCNIDMSLPYEYKTCTLDTDEPDAYPPMRCPFKSYYPNWERVEE